MCIRDRNNAASASMPSVAPMPVKVAFLRKDLLFMLQFTRNHLKVG
jgi:hypothetical protein